MIRYFISHLSFTFVLLSGIAQSSGETAVYEPFQYSEGTLCDSPVRPNASAGFSGDWKMFSEGGDIRVEPSSDIFKDIKLLKQGNLIEIVPRTANATALRPLKTSLSDQVFYLSFLAQVSNSGQRFFGVALMNGEDQRLFIGQITGSSFWGIFSPVTGKSALSSVDSSTPSLLVARLEFNSNGKDTINLYVNPKPGSPEPATPDATQSYKMGEIDGLLVGAGFNSPTDRSASGYLDEIRIGSSFESVIPAGK